jgi:diguanylate cyclase (GGDEF)-like protein/PAS domain S-box-containing protein
VNYALAFNTAVNLIVGITLLLAWRRDPRQTFSRDLGWAYLTQGFVPLAYLAFQSPDHSLAAVGLVGIISLSALYLSLLVLGSARLAGFAPTRARSLALLVGLVVLSAFLLEASTRLAQTVGAALHIAAGMVATGWLWRLGAAERLVGVLLVLIGINQLTYVIVGEQGVAVQAAVAAVLRLTLGLALLHAAVRRSTEETRRLRNRFQQLTERSHQGVAVVQGENLTYANPAFLAIYGLSSLSEVNTLWRDATMPEAERSIGRERHRRIVAGEVAQADWEGQRFRFDGTPIRLRFSAWRIEWDGEPAEQVVVTDETVQHNATSALLHQATHDDLTGLPNRSALLQRLRERCGRKGGGAADGFALVLLDIDRFKLFNEAHGHAVGDEVLGHLASTLNTALAGRAEVMRLGEDEFALLAPGAGDELAARALSQQVRELLSRALTLHEHAFFLDVSMGIALFPADADTPDALLRAANAAMHQAKRTPGTSVQFAEARFERGSSAVLDAEQALRAGVGNDEFLLFYQPKVDAASGRLVGLEALVRWDRPGLGRIAPDDFIPAAERTGLIGALGRVILVQACQQLAAWQQAGAAPVPVAVNVSPLQLLEPHFPEMVVDTLRAHEVPPSLLTLEITESAAVTHLDQARAQISQLREHGVQVALDDFGTGFSSLNLLRSLPVGTVKIDRTLIEPLPGAEAQAVVKAICELAAVLRLEVVAEGIETEAQARSAREAGCDVLQGALYAAPLTAEAVRPWLVAR